MDPTTTLSDMQSLINRLLARANREDVDPDAVELATLTHSLHEWLKGGGFLPNQWRPAAPRTAQVPVPVPATGNDEHYGELNERFDARAAVLREAGYVYGIIPGLPVAVFTRTRAGKLQAVASGTVLNADEIVWEDTVRLLVP